MQLCPFARHPGRRGLLGEQQHDTGPASQHAAQLQGGGTLLDGAGHRVVAGRAAPLDRDHPMAVVQVVAERLGPRVRALGVRAG
jgi:hypothetical protein